MAIGAVVGMAIVVTPSIAVTIVAAMVHIIGAVHGSPGTSASTSVSYMACCTVAVSIWPKLGAPVAFLRMRAAATRCAASALACCNCWVLPTATRSFLYGLVQELGSTDAACRQGCRLRCWIVHHVRLCNRRGCHVRSKLAHMLLLPCTPKGLSLRSSP